LCLRFPPPISLDPPPIQSCIDKIKAAQDVDDDAVIALLELSLCDVRKVSDAEMESVWQVSL
jgi:hypothetical protein